MRTRGQGVVAWYSPDPAAWGDYELVPRLKVDCPFCGAAALVGLPSWERAKEANKADGTTHVCAPFLGGCNHGFAE